MADESAPSSPTSETPPPRTTGGNWRWEPPSAEELQKLMPGYTIEKILGRGGMGAVYRGVQTNLDRPVAIKILPPGVEKEDPSFAERFKSEARLMARLSNPAVVGVYDFGTNLGGQLYFAMEYVDGSDVSQMIAAQGKLPPEHALAITAHVCDALQAAHDLGIVHRDIKPANVLINMKGQVKVADFGLAKVEEPGQHGLTKTGYAMGTPDFVAPEALMLGTAIDGRADLYAVGVMLYQMLTGNIPRGAFKPASVLVPGLDPRFDPIILKAMQHDREERHQSAAELRRELDVILTVPLLRNDAPVSAAIPVAQVAEAPGQRSAAQRPVAKGPPPRERGTPLPQHQGPAPSGVGAPRSQPKSKAPLFIGLGAAAAIGVGAFVMFSGGEKAKPKGPPAPSSGAKVTQASGQPPQPAAGTTAPASKPATPPQASTFTSSAAAQSSDPQFPPGQWVKVLTKVEDLPPALRSRQPSGMKDGWIKAADSGEQLRLPPQLTGNYAMRAHFRRRADNKRASYLNLRAYGSDKQRYQLFLSDGGFLSLQSLQAGKFISLASVQSQQKFMPGEAFQLSLGVVGARLVMRLGSEVLRSHVDTTHASGAGFLHLQDDVRDIEVINLDGLPEAEALRILGVDEKGNDLRKPTTLASTSPVPATAKPSASPGSTSASLPASKSPTFPPGQWVKVFTKFEDLPEGMRKANSGVKFEDGWIRFANDKRRYLTLPFAGPVSNLAIRAMVLREVTGDEGWTMITARESKSGRYAFSAKVPGIFYTVDGSVAGSVVQLSSALHKPPLNLGSAFKIEVAVIGERLFARRNGELLNVVHDNRQHSGNASISGFEDLRDIEVINLDGLPEAEALRILGVDEKGNDLRALAAKQEEMQKVQAAQADAMAAIPELKALHEQFVKLQAERVTAPFEADVTKLNAGYVGGLDRKIGEMKQKGDLDAVLALEEEKKLVIGARTPSSAVVPMTTNADGGVRAPDDTPDLPALKDLRQIYRDAYAKLEATRAANLELLTDPLDARLKQIEATLTQQDRIDHAKTVREYREGLGKEASAGTPARNASNGSTTATMNGADKSARAPLKKFPPGDDRKAAEWALSVGGSVKIQGGDKVIVDTTDLPRGRFELAAVNLEFTSTNRPKGPIDNFMPLAGLKGLVRLNVRNVAVTESHWEILPSLPSLESLLMERTGVTDAVFASLAATKVKNLDLNYESALSGEGIEALGAAKSLEKISMYSCQPSEEGLRQLGLLESLTSLALPGSGNKLRDEHLPLLAGLKKLESLVVRRSALTAEALAAMKQWSGLTTLGFDMKPGTTAAQVALLTKAFPKLETLSLQGEVTWNYAAEDISALAGFSGLKYLMITSSAINDEALAGVLTLSKLESLRISDSTKITDTVMATFVRHKALTTLSFEAMPAITDAGLAHLTNLRPLTRLQLLRCPKLTEAAIAAFKKTRPDVTVMR